LIERAGAAVARSALRELGGAYGRRVIVITGKGSNGEDGKVAAKRLERRGVRVQLINADETPKELPDVDLVLDAAYGTGLKRPYEAPLTNSTVLSVDIPSGVDGHTGCSIGRPFKAKKTLTFNALKPGHIFSDGARLSGELEIADIGLDTSSLSCGLVTDDDVSRPISAISNSPLRRAPSEKICPGLSALKVKVFFALKGLPIEQPVCPSTPEGMSTDNTVEFVKGASYGLFRPVPYAASITRSTSGNSLGVSSALISWTRTPLRSNLLAATFPSSPLDPFPVITITLRP
jgi:NAD(P)H-hydrate repair Nnr-like enzyme with NAD(P)H-hydrate epimerase domain